MSKKQNLPVEIVVVEILCEYFKVAVITKMAVAFPYSVVVPDVEPEHCCVINSYK